MLQRLKYNKHLGNGITTNVQLTKALKHLPGFRGVVDRKDFFRIYPTLRAGDSMIINIDPNYSQDGTHWIALKISNDNTTILYKDSFGAPPPQDFYRNLGREVLYGTNIYQQLDEENCGQRAADFITKLVDAGSNDKKIFYRIA